MQWLWGEEGCTPWEVILQVQLFHKVQNYFKNLGGKIYYIYTLSLQGRETVWALFSCLCAPPDVSLTTLTHTHKCTYDTQDAMKQCKTQKTEDWHQRPSFMYVHWCIATRSSKHTWVLYGKTAMNLSLKHNPLSTLDRGFIFLWYVMFISDLKERRSLINITMLLAVHHSIVYLLSKVAFHSLLASN